MILLIPLCLPLAGTAVLALSPKGSKRRDDLIMLLFLCASALVGLVSALAGGTGMTLWHMTKNVEIALNTDTIGRIWLGLISIVWPMAGIFSVGYNAHDPAYRRFNCFYLATYGILVGLSAAKNAITLYMFYEMMTLITVPLVMHTGEKDAVAAGIKYLIYSVFGASAALLGIFLLNRWCVSLDFVPGGTIDPAAVAGHGKALSVTVFVMLLGFGVKAGMFPMHAWLPTAHPVAPAPASAVLSGVITKAGVLGVIRVLFYMVGADRVRGTWVQTVFTVLTLITVFMGSLLALREKILKKRLAYSSVSQVSYVLFGLSTLTPLGFVGAILHVVCHSLIKNTLFLSAGAVIHQSGRTNVDDLTGIGRRMPKTMVMFTIASLGLVGIPPTGGFISKWYLAQGALSGIGGARWIGPAILLCSALMTAGYLFTVAIRAFFPGQAELPDCAECGKVMWIPLCILAVLSVLVGIFPQVLIAPVTELTALLF